MLCDHTGSNVSQITTGTLKDMPVSEEALADVSLGEPATPLVITANKSGTVLAEWVAHHRVQVDLLLYHCGAILFRNFGVDDPGKLQTFAQSFGSELLDYADRGAPRVSLANKVFSSTEYAKEETIPLHHEMSYSPNFPGKLFFCCQLPSPKGGRTPIACDRRVIRDIPEAIKQEFMHKGVTYVRNYGLGIDMSWQEAFDTNDKDVVAEYLRKTDTEFEWKSDDHLQTMATRPAVVRHPATDELIWFNHAHLFHMSNMPADIREFLIEEFTEKGLPRNVFFGDGSSISTDVVEQIRNIYNNNANSFVWQKGDALLLDNFLVSHGRTPFSGDRKICVAMSELYSHPDKFQDNASEIKPVKRL